MSMPHKGDFRARTLVETDRDITWPLKSYSTKKLQDPKVVCSYQRCLQHSKKKLIELNVYNRKEGFNTLLSTDNT